MKNSDKKIIKYYIDGNLIPHPNNLSESNKIDVFSGVIEQIKKSDMSPDFAALVSGDFGTKPIHNN